MTRVQVEPDLLRWACERSRLDSVTLGRRFPRLDSWVRGEKQPTFRQLEDFARYTHTPIGFLFLPEPPVEKTPIPDLRTVGNRPLDAPSPDLLETIHQCQQRQEWYREYARSVGETSCDFVGSATLGDDVVRVAARMRDVLHLDLEERGRIPNWTEALRRLIAQADAAGILVMVSGVVGSDNHRGLDPEEFRGFALSDPIAPLVFVNGADTKAAQMFTLAHELAHVWLGETALSNPDMRRGSTVELERFCNEIAAEMLVPRADIEKDFDANALLRAELDRLARRFKVSTLVILRRLHDSGRLSREAYRVAYRDELALLTARPSGGGGDFYLTLGARVSKRFARAVVVSALEGRATFTEAFRLLGFRKMSTFDELGRSLGVIA